MSDQYTVYGGAPRSTQYSTFEGNSDIPADWATEILFDTQPPALPAKPKDNEKPANQVMAH